MFLLILRYYFYLKIFPLFLFKLSLLALLMYWTLKNLFETKSMFVYSFCCSWFSSYFFSFEKLLWILLFKDYGHNFLEILHRLISEFFPTQAQRILCSGNTSLTLDLRLILVRQLLYFRADVFHRLSESMWHSSFYIFEGSRKHL